jgi:hypothetical protein
VTTAITNIVLADSEGASFIGVAKQKARYLYAALERTGRKISAHRFEVSEAGKTFYIEINIQRPHVRIYIDSTKCPTYLSGLVWVKSFFEPTVTVDEVEYLRTMFKKEAPLVEENVSKLAPIGAELLQVRSTMFTGEMRKVVQLLQGMGKPVPYSHTAGTTHGVFRVSGLAPWIIKISRDGVVAYPMAVCRGKNSPTDLKYTPLPTPEPEEPRVLMTAAQIKDAYSSKGAFYAQCGWAFSANGSKAANCFVGSEDIYSYSWQYQISISADPETGAPVSATLALLKEGYIHGPKSTHMKFPRGDIPMALRSFDPFRGNTNYLKECNAPVFCYFEGETLQTYFYVFSPGGSVSRTDSFDRPETCWELEGVLTYSGSYSESPRPTIQLNSANPYNAVNDQRSTRMFTTSYLGIGIESGFSLNPEFVMSAVMLTMNEETGKNVSVSRIDVLIVTGYEREAAYLGETTVTSSGSYRLTVVNHTAQKDAWNYRRTEQCEATGATSTNLLVVTDFRGSVFAEDTCQSGLRYGYKGMDVWPGTGPGSTIRLAQQIGFVPGWNGCLGVRETDSVFFAGNFSNVALVDITIPSKTTVSYKLTLRGSGNFTAGIDGPDSELEDWMDFIEPGMNDQTAHIVRDAFKPQRASYSKTVLKTRGFELHKVAGFAPYDLSAVTGSMLSFVGEP